MENEIQSEQKKKWHIKRWWIVVFVIIILWVIISASLKSAKEKAQEAEKQEQDTVINQPTHNQETKTKATAESLRKENIELNKKAENSESAQNVPEKNTKEEQVKNENKETNITRSEIINLFPEFSFTKGSAVDGKENYVGRSKEDAIFQIIGAEDNISEIALTTIMSPKSVKNMEKQDEYLIRLRNKLTPSMNDYDMSKLKDTGDKVEIDGYEIVYSFIDFGKGTYSATHTFKKIK